MPKISTSVPVSPGCRRLPVTTFLRQGVYALHAGIYVLKLSSSAARTWRIIHCPISARLWPLDTLYEYMDLRRWLKRDSINRLVQIVDSVSKTPLPVMGKSESRFDLYRDWITNIRILCMWFDWNSIWNPSWFDWECNESWITMHCRTRLNSQTVESPIFCVE